MRGLHITCLVLAIIGAINWGLVGFFEFDLVASLFGGQDAAMSRFVYGLVGLAGLVLAFTSAAYFGGRTIGFDREHAHGGRHVAT